MDHIGDHHEDLPSKVGHLKVGQPVVSITAGKLHTCALLADGTLKCWGCGRHGKLGHGHEGDSMHPEEAAVVKIGDVPVHSVDAGAFHTCALREDGSLRCWGHNGVGQLGHGYESGKHVGDDEHPDSVGDVPLADKATSVACGGTHTCAIVNNGQVKCWGHNKYGQLGNRGFTTHMGCVDVASKAVPVEGLNGPVKQLALGMSFSCALLESGDVQCWGNNQNGAIGEPPHDPVQYPGVPEFVDRAHKTVDIGGKVKSIDAGAYHVCALLDNSQVRCWGGADSGTVERHQKGQLGYGPRFTRELF